jgi:hypothetical protein
MKRSSLVLVFVVFFLVALANAAASETTHNVNIAFNGHCDTMELTLSGSPPISIAGTHDLSACTDINPNLSPIEYVVGFRHRFYWSIDPRGSSKVLDVMDPALGYYDDLPYALEYLINTDETCAWAIYEDTGSGHVLSGAGTCRFFKTGSPPTRWAGSQPSFETHK